MNITRRNFLTTAGLSLVSVLVGVDIFLNLYDKFNNNDKKNTERIYNEINPYTYLFSIDVGCDEDSENNKKEISALGTGIVLEKRFLTLGHLFLPVNECKGEIDYVKISSYGSELGDVVYDSKNEIVLFNLPKNSKLKNFPYTSSNEIYLGKEVYIVANPVVSGFEIKKTNVCNLNKEDNGIILTKNCFGVSEKIEHGASGSPVVDSNNNLLGLCTSYFNGVTYVKRIREFLKYL